LDDLLRFITGRIVCRIHPYIPPDEGWRRYPPHMAKMLEVLEPIHVIVLTDGFVGVDGACVDDSRSMHEKYDLAVEAVERIFGETSEKIGVAFNCEVRLHASGIVDSISFFQGSVWYLAPSVRNQPYPSRFAYVADWYRCFARKSLRGSDVDRVECVVCVDEGPKATMPVSPRFFLDPKPENAELFGDLCFLAQMVDGWAVEREIALKLDGYKGSSWSWSDDLYVHVANILRGSVGLKSFVGHGYKELLLRDSADPSMWGWRKLLRMLEAK